MRIDGDDDRRSPLIRLPPLAFSREDEGDDADFYSVPRLEYHIDHGAIAALTGLYREELPAGGAIIDLMRSWVSHLPADVAYGEVIGHGMNEEELAANPRLSRWFIQDLNRDSRLPLADECIDAAMICVGVQYLKRPVAVLTEVARILRPGAPVAVAAVTASSLATASRMSSYPGAITAFTTS